MTAHPGSISLEQIMCYELIQENQPLTEVIGDGGYSRVYKLTDDYVVKVMFDDGHRDRNRDYEYIIANELYEAGISVPKPVGLFDVKVVRAHYGRIFMEEGGFVLERGFVMDRVRDDKVECFDKGRELGQRLDRELTKCEELSFIPHDNCWYGRGGHNVLYDKKQDKLYLIDFGLWERKFWKRILG